MPKLIIGNFFCIIEINILCKVIILFKVILFFNLHISTGSDSCPHVSWRQPIEFVYIIIKNMEITFYTNQRSSAVEHESLNV